jgi:prolyl-tRNA editing enzyme YbaK/EbsC (Cys-tRNA(Pro) deacylase)
MEALLDRIHAAERKLEEYEIKYAIDRVKSDLESRGVFTGIFRTVPEDYYSKPLEGRAQILNTTTIHSLCKTIVFENVNYRRNSHARCDESDYSDISNSKYYCVVVQYTAKIDTDELALAIINLRKPGESRLGTSYFNFQLAPESVSGELTGFAHNGVSPFGMRNALPMLICERALATNPPMLWFGGGHPRVKLCLSVSDFLRGSKALHALVSHSRKSDCN